MKISASEEGSEISLHTVREVAAGELLSISYVGAYQPTKRRQALLEAQHGFVCGCARCTSLPETTRAFRCPSCGEGPCSPTSPAPSCREVTPQLEFNTATMPRSPAKSLPPLSRSNLSGSLVRAPPLQLGKALRNRYVTAV